MEQEPVKYGAFKEITDELSKEEIVSALEKGGTFPRTIYKSAAVGISTVEPKGEISMNDELIRATAMLAAEKCGHNANVAPQLLFGDIYLTFKAVLEGTARGQAPQPPCTNDHVADGCEQFSACDEKPCPTCHDQDEIVCSFCETCKGAGWVPKVAD